MKSRNLRPPTVFFFKLFWPFGAFWDSMNFMMNFYFCNKHKWNFDRDCVLNLWITVGNTDILILSISVCVHKVNFYLCLSFLSVTLFSLCNFFLPWVTLFLGILFFFDAIANEIFLVSLLYDSFLASKMNDFCFWVYILQLCWINLF